MKNKIYNIGIVGYGDMAGNHCKELERGNVRVEFRGVYDTDRNRMLEAAKHGLIAYDSYDRLLADDKIEIVLVAASNEVHKELAIEALRAGKHVLCEKPVTLSSNDLEEIIKTAKECDRIFSIDQNRRNNRDFISMWKTLDSGVIGTPYVIESRVEGARGIPSGWRTQKKHGGGMMYDWGVHLIDQLMYMRKEKVTSVFCEMFSIHYPEVDDNFRLTFTFESGLTAYVEVSTNSYIKHDRFFVLGTEGTMIVNEWDGTGKVVRGIKDDREDIKYGKNKVGPSKTMAPRRMETVEIIEIKTPEDVVDNLDPVYEQFINAIEGAELKIKPEEALRVMRVMEAAFESAKTRTVINVNI